MLQSTLLLYKNAYSGLSNSVWWLSLVVLVNRIGTMVVLFLTVYLTDIGYSTVQAGYVMGAFGLGSVLGGYLGGRLTDKFGFFYVQVYSLMINGILLIVLGYMNSLLNIVICIFLLSSLGEAFRPANSTAIASYSTGANLTRSYSLNRLAMNIGFAFGPALGGIFSEISYKLMFWADGITCIMASFLLYFLFRSENRKKMQKAVVVPHIKVSSAWKDRIFLAGMFCLFLVGLCFFQMFNIIPVYFKQVLLFSNSTTGILMALNGLLIAVFEMILVYKLERKRNPVFYMMAGAFLIGLAFLSLNIAPVFIIALGLIIIVTLGEMLLFPFINNFWVNRSNEYNRGQYAGVYTMSFSMAIVLAPILSAYVAQYGGFSMLWVLNFIVCCMAVFGYYLLRKKMNNERI